MSTGYNQELGCLTSCFSIHGHLLTKRCIVVTAQTPFRSGNRIHPSIIFYNSVCPVQVCLVLILSKRWATPWAGRQSVAGHILYKTAIQTYIHSIVEGTESMLPVPKSSKCTIAPTVITAQIEVERAIFFYTAYKYFNYTPNITNLNLIWKGKK